jgi:hypothetical protein
LLTPQVLKNDAAMKKKPRAKMRSVGYSFDEFYDAISTVWGWTMVIGSAMILGFVTGYWIGHRQIMPAEQTVRAFAAIPLLWLRFKETFLAYIVTALAWYVPLHREEWQLRLAAPLLTSLAWIGVIISVVVQAKASKLFQF